MSSARYRTCRVFAVDAYSIKEVIMIPIVVVGSLNVDLTFSVNSIPSRGETVSAKDFHVSPGGKGANQAIAAARLGADVSMVGRVGADPYGDMMLSNMHGNKVDTSHIFTDTMLKTGTAMITVEKGGTNTIAVYQGANGACLPSDVDAAEDIISKACALIVQLEIPIESVERAVCLAKKHSVFTILNPAPVCELTPELLSNVDLLVPNETEAEYLAKMRIESSRDAVEAARKLRSMGPERVVVTLGAKGAVFAGPEGEIYTPSYLIDAVDSTGAGDTFLAALTVALMDQMEMSSALSYACAAGGIATSRMGAQSAFPTREDVEGFLYTNTQGRCF